MHNPTHDGALMTAYLVKLIAMATAIGVARNSVKCNRIGTKKRNPVRRLLLIYPGVVAMAEISSSPLGEETSQLYFTLL